MSTSLPVKNTMQSSDAPIHDIAELERLTALALEAAKAKQYELFAELYERQEVGLQALLQQMKTEANTLAPSARDGWGRVVKLREETQAVLASWLDELKSELAVVNQNSKLLKTYFR